MSRRSVLVVDDDAVFRAALVRFLEGAGYEVSAAGEAETALRSLEERPFDLTVSDVRMPGLDGIELVTRIRAVDPDAAVVVLSGFGSPEMSADAHASGAVWYLEKDYKKFDLIQKVIDRELETRSLRRKNVQLQRQLEVRYGFENIVGESEALRTTLDLVRKVADTDATVLILGESGVGKELIARALHYNSRRAQRPFVPVNCGAIPEELLESELFGHVRGSFTGAFRDREGRFAAADRGTLFLDEIGDMSPVLQTKLLRVLQEREFEPVGSSKTLSVDVRIVAATNQDLPELIRAGCFREDLYFRLNVLPIQIPPLRQRREDISLLADYFVNVLRRKYPDIRGLTKVALKRPEEHNWPGNVRELESLIERLIILKRSGWIDESALPPEVGGSAPDFHSVELPKDGVDFSAVVEAFETDLIRQALEATSWNKKQAAELLGLKRTTLVEKIRAKSIQPN